MALLFPMKEEQEEGDRAWRMRKKVLYVTAAARREGGGAACRT